MYKNKYTKKTSAKINMQKFFVQTFFDYLFLR